MADVVGNAPTAHLFSLLRGATTCTDKHMRSVCSIYSDFLHQFTGVAPPQKTPRIRLMRPCHEHDGTKVEIILLTNKNNLPQHRKNITASIFPCFKAKNLRFYPQNAPIFVKNR